MFQNLAPIIELSKTKITFVIHDMVSWDGARTNGNKGAVPGLPGDGFAGTEFPQMVNSALQLLSVPEWPQI